MRRYDGRTQVGSALKDSHIKPSPAIGSIVSIRPSHPTSALARPDAPTWTGQRTWWSPWCIPGYNLSNIYIYNKIILMLFCWSTLLSVCGCGCCCWLLCWCLFFFWLLCFVLVPSCSSVNEIYPWAPAQHLKRPGPPWDQPGWSWRVRCFQTPPHWLNDGKYLNI